MPSERKRSKKPVKPLSECTKPFVFEIDGKGARIVPASAAHFFSLKIMGRAQNFYNLEDYDYDPFKV
ncbi:MAG: hypothetical protein KCHDKBKB_00777 [Elusimicrobia bacterium]|nr:hypothetical protein [Elusimicrobiota bacterium]